MEGPAAHATTLGALADAFEALEALATEPFSGPVAVVIVRLIQWAHPYYARYLEARTLAASSHGEKLAEGRYHIPSQNVAAFNQAMAPARAEPVDIDTALLIPVEGLAGVKISPLTLAALRPFVAGL